MTLETWTTEQAKQLQWHFIRQTKETTHHMIWLKSGNLNERNWITNNKTTINKNLEQLDKKNNYAKISIEKTEKYNKCKSKRKQFHKEIQ